MRSAAGTILIKICEFALTALLVSFFTFIAFSVIPGDPARVMLGTDASEEQVENLRAEMGVDRPLSVRYLDWLGGALKGDLGDSLSFKTPVNELIKSRLPVTLGMSLMALIIVLIVAFPMAAVCASRPGSLTDRIVSAFGHVLFAVPAFALSMLLILLFTKVFGIYTAGRYTAPSDDAGKYIASLLLPSVCIALPKIAMTFKFLRSSMIEQNASDHVRTARSHGLSDAVIEMRHVLPNSNVSAITVISLVLSDILGGSLIVEQVFNLPGLGRLLLTGISRRDFPLLSGMILYLAFITVFLYFLADILTALADPRIRIK